jgi:tripartite-type tricarboxylate transporter receptor subunit TctC
VCDVTTAMPMIRNGRLRPLAVTTGKRVLGLEQVPTLAEARLPGFDFAGWMAFAAPTGTPASVLQRFNRDLDAVLLDKDVAARLQAIGPITEGAGTLEQTAAFVQGEHARWSKLIRDLGIQPE